MHSYMETAKKAFLAVIAIAACAVVIAVPVGIYKGTESTERITVTGKEVKDDVYLVYTDEGETFCISDDLLSLRFDSSDTYGLIESGDVYEVDVIGMRIKLFSVYRNILSAEKVVDE